MRSEGTNDFWERYRNLPPRIRRQAVIAYRLFCDNPQHPSLRFKRLRHPEPFYSARVTDNYRVIGLIVDGTIYWDFIGTHAEYDRYIDNL